MIAAAGSRLPGEEGGAPRHAICALCGGDLPPRARLQDGDLIVRFGGAAIDGVDALHRALRTWPAGQPARWS